MCVWQTIVTNFFLCSFCQRRQWSFIQLWFERIASGEVIVFIWQRKLQLVAAISLTISQGQRGLAMLEHVIGTTGDEGLNVIIMPLGIVWWIEVWFEPYTRWIQSHFISYFNLVYNYFAVIRNLYSLKTIYGLHILCTPVWERCCGPVHPQSQFNVIEEIEWFHNAI